MIMCSPQICGRGNSSAAWPEHRAAWRRLRYGTASRRFRPAAGGHCSALDGLAGAFAQRIEAAGQVPQHVAVQLVGRGHHLVQLQAEFGPGHFLAALDLAGVLAEQVAGRCPTATAAPGPMDRNGSNSYSSGGKLLGSGPRRRRLAASESAGSRNGRLVMADDFAKCGLVAGLRRQSNSASPWASAWRGGGPGGQLGNFRVAGRRTVGRGCRGRERNAWVSRFLSYWTRQPPGSPRPRRWRAAGWIFDFAGSSRACCCRPIAQPRTCAVRVNKYPLQAIPCRGFRVRFHAACLVAIFGLSVLSGTLAADCTTRRSRGSYRSSSAITDGYSRMPARHLVRHGRPAMPGLVKLLRIRTTTFGPGRRKGDSRDSCHRSRKRNKDESWPRILAAVQPTR